MKFDSLMKIDISVRSDYIDVEDILRRSKSAYDRYSRLTINNRKEIINKIRQSLMPAANKLANMEMQENGMGNIHDKIIKILLAIQKTPGVEDLKTEVTTGDNGMTLYEYSSHGCVCALTPSNNPCATIICNTIGMIAAGNSVIFIPHPRCEGSSLETVKLINEIIYEVSGIEDLIMSVTRVSHDVSQAIMNHPDIALVVATGSEEKIDKALYSSKRVIAASNGNPVVIVDETADMAKAAKDIIEGATFDNGLICLAESNIVVVNAAAERIIDALKSNGAYYVRDLDEIMQLTKATITSDMSIKRSMIGKTANEILKAAGINVDRYVSLIVVDTFKSHPFATCQMLMPLIPLIRTDDFASALDVAIFLEAGCKHSAYIHSKDISHLDEAANRMRTSIFVKNGSSLVALGLQGDGNTSFTIANRTGEGATSARDFARRRKCTLTSGFHIR